MVFGLIKRKRMRNSIGGTLCILAMKNKTVEVLENRFMLAVDIPLSIDPIQSEYVLFAPGATQYSIDENSLGTTSQYYRFSADANYLSYAAQFSLYPDSPLRHRPRKRGWRNTMRDHGCRDWPVR